MTSHVGEPYIEYRGEKHDMGIRTQTPFKGMFAVVDQLRKGLYGWFKAQDIEPEGPAFLRYHVIDMAGEGGRMKTASPGINGLMPKAMRSAVGMRLISLTLKLSHEKQNGISIWRSRLWINIKRVCSPVF